MDWEHQQWQKAISQGERFPAPMVDCDVLPVILLVILWLSTPPISLILSPLLFYDVQWILHASIYLIYQPNTVWIKCLLFSFQKWKLCLSTTKLFLKATNGCGKKQRVRQSHTGRCSKFAGAYQGMG